MYFISIIRFWAVAGSSCLEIKSCTVFFNDVLVRRGEVFFKFAVERIVGELPKGFLFNPLRPNSDLSQTSHCNIKALSVREVMRIENKITPVKFY